MFIEPSSGPAAVMTRLCDELAALVPELAPAVAPIQAMASAPLRVAIVGPLNSGKSTLVNALLGRRFVPTPVSESSRVPTWFHFGTTETVVIVPKDGAPRRLALPPNGCLPLDFGQPSSTIERIDVTLNNATLHGLVLIDTPGLGAINEYASAATDEVLHTAADAVLFVFSQTLTAADRSVIDEFSDKASGPRNSPLRMIAVLAKADLLADEGGDLRPAQRLAQRFATGLRHRVVSVVPVVGLLGETVRTGFLTESLTTEIATIAKATDRRLQLASPAHFVRNSHVRWGLLDRLSTFGVAAAVAYLDRGGENAALGHYLSEISGIDALEEIVERRFRDAAVVLQVERGLRDLEKVASDPSKVNATQRRVVLDALDRARQKPEMHRVAELNAEDSLLRGNVTFPADKLQAALRILGVGRPEERLGRPEITNAAQLAALALTVSDEWRETAITPDPELSRIAFCVSRSAYLLHRSLVAQV